MQVAAQAARSGHGKFAVELRELVDQVRARAKAVEPTRGPKPVPLAQPRGELAGLLSVNYPKTRLADMALTEVVRKKLDRVVNEQGQRARIREHGFFPMRKRTAVVRLNRELNVKWCSLSPLGVATPDDIGISRPGTLAVAVVQGEGITEPITLVSLYGAWEVPHGDTQSSWIYADASVHRLISDLSVLIGQQKAHRIIAAGDLNILYGYGESGRQYWAARYKTVFDRMEVLGLPFVGPQYPRGRQADPWPEELPKESTVPTFHSNRQTPTTAARQLDFVFASTQLVDRLSVRALNDAETWGPSDHCQIEIALS